MAGASGWVARLPVAKMATEHPEAPKGELQLPPPPPPGHYGAWAAQELQAKLAEIGAPIQGEGIGGACAEAGSGDPGDSGWGRSLLGVGVGVARTDPELGPAGSREELVERLQTYTRQVRDGSGAPPTARSVW